MNYYYCCDYYFLYSMVLLVYGILVNVILIQIDTHAFGDSYSVRIYLEERTKEFSIKCVLNYHWSHFDIGFTCYVRSNVWMVIFFPPLLLNTTLCLHPLCWACEECEHWAAFTLFLLHCSRFLYLFFLVFICLVFRLSTFDIRHVYHCFHHHFNAQIELLFYLFDSIWIRIPLSLQYFFFVHFGFPKLLHSFKLQNQNVVFRFLFWIAFDALGLCSKPNECIIWTSIRTNHWMAMTMATSSTTLKTFISHSVHCMCARVFGVRCMYEAFCSLRIFELNKRLDEYWEHLEHCKFWF